jgi:molybdate transport system substrate-binding protein
MIPPPPLTILGAHVLTTILSDPLQQFASELNVRLHVNSCTSSDVIARILKDEPFDIALGLKDSFEELIAEGKLIRTHIIAQSIIGLAIRIGAARAPIDTTDAFVALLLAARKVAYADPATGSPSGRHIAKILHDLGLAQAIEPKAILVKGHGGGAIRVAEAVAAGDADVGLQQIAEIRQVAGVEVLGPLPRELQRTTIFASGLATRAQNNATKLFPLLISAKAAEAFRQAGMEPVAG